MIDKIGERPLVALSWIGSSIGAVDLGLVAADVFATAPTEQLLGAATAEVLVFGYLLAGGVALADDLMRWSA